MDAAEEAVPGMKQEILSGKLKGTDQAIRAIGKAEPEQREELARQLQNLPPSPGRRRHQEAQDAEADGYDGGANAGADDTEDDTGEEDDGLSPIASSRRTKAEELQAIQEISDNMLSSDGRGTAEDMLYELRDALDTLMDRWDLCLATYEVVYRKKKYRRQVKPFQGIGAFQIMCARKTNLFRRIS